MDNTDQGMVLGGVGIGIGIGTPTGNGGGRKAWHWPFGLLTCSRD